MPTLLKRGPIEGKLAATKPMSDSTMFQMAGLALVKVMSSTWMRMV